MKKTNKKILYHITNWYPSPEKPYEAIWIQRHIRSLQSDFYQQILHLEVKPGSAFRLKRGKYPDGACYCLLWLPFKQWVFVEIASFILLIYYLIIKKKGRRVDLINFHVAYPLLRFWNVLKKWVRKPIVVNEHYSAYHFGFHISKESKLGKIRRIFSHKMLLLPVSLSLKYDIERFCKHPVKNWRVLPNIVSSKFKYDPTQKREKAFFVLSNFNYPKRPDILLEAFQEFVQIYPDYKLYVAGMDKSDPGLAKYLQSHNADGQVYALGRLNEDQICFYMNKAEAFLHCSEYETFSVVCAEALACGLPVIASRVGGIPEFVEKQNGILVHEQTLQAWINAMKQFSMKKKQFCPRSIAEKAQVRFSMETVGKQYQQALNNYLQHYG